MPRQQNCGREFIMLSAHQNTISHDDNRTLHIDPLITSREVTENPSFYNQFQTSLQQEMQQDPQDSFDQETQSRSPKAPKSAQQRRSKNFISKEGPKTATFVFDSRTGNPVPAKRRKAHYSEEKRLKVAETRRRGACRVHRKKKLSCPENCIYNKKVSDCPQISDPEGTKLDTSNSANNDRSSLSTFPDPYLELPMDFFPDLDSSTFTLPELQFSTHLDPNFNFDWDSFWNEPMGSQSTDSSFGFDLNWQPNADLFPE